jgi:hypothetical protein
MAGKHSRHPAGLVCRRTVRGGNPSVSRYPRALVRAMQPRERTNAPNREDCQGNKNDAILSHAVCCRLELTNAGGPRCPNWHPTWLARIPSSDFVGRPDRHFALGRSACLGFACQSRMVLAHSTVKLKLHVIEKNMSIRIGNPD